MGDTVSKVVSIVKDISPIVSAGATVAGVAAPLLMGDTKMPEVEQGPTIGDIASEAAEETEKRRRQLLKKKGGQSTIRTSPLSQDKGSLSTSIKTLGGL